MKITKISKITKKNKTNKFTKTNTKIRSLSNPNFYIGCHASIANGILDGIKYGESIGANAFQIFMGSHRSASLKAKTKFNKLWRSRRC